MGSRRLLEAIETSRAALRDGEAPQRDDLDATELAKNYPWALRVVRFDDNGLSSEYRAALEGSRGEGRVPMPNWFPPRSTWGEGPWMTEPDLVEWRFPTVPFPLMILRGGMGALCGYIGVPPTHPLHGKVDPGLGFNWTSPSGGFRIATGEPPHFWWFGFDCGHTGQYSPAMATGMQIMAELADQQPWRDNPDQTYVGIEQCRRKTEALALLLLDERDTSG